MTKLHQLGAQIDALLPQTQCGLCEYPGCKPYAEAIAEKGERINRCLPGGIPVLEKLGVLLNRDPEPYFAEMEKNQKTESIVVIREDDCIGCTKCIQACPVDAIIGGPKLMHTVIRDACTGCDLCISPCPVDCIDIIKIPARSEIEKNQMAEKSRDRFENRNSRLEKIKNAEKNRHNKAKLSAPEKAIQEAILRAKEKKTS